MHACLEICVTYPYPNLPAVQRLHISPFLASFAWPICTKMAFWRNDYLTACKFHKNNKDLKNPMGALQELNKTPEVRVMHQMFGQCENAVLEGMALLKHGSYL